MKFTFIHWKPWISGDNDIKLFSLLVRYSCQHSQKKFAKKSNDFSFYLLFLVPLPKKFFLASVYNYSFFTFLSTLC